MYFSGCCVDVDDFEAPIQNTHPSVVGQGMQAARQSIRGSPLQGLRPVTRLAQLANQQPSNHLEPTQRSGHDEITPRQNVYIYANEVKINFNGKQMQSGSSAKKPPISLKESDNLPRRFDSLSRDFDLTREQAQMIQLATVTDPVAMFSENALSSFNTPRFRPEYDYFTQSQLNPSLL
jgi:hypothetical protein